MEMEITLPDAVPVMTLATTAFFPQALMPLRIFEQRYLGMAKACLRDEAPFGVCRIREGAEVGAEALLLGRKREVQRASRGTARRVCDRELLSGRHGRFGRRR